MSETPAVEPVDYTSWTDEALAEKSAELADERTRVRLDQNAVNAEVELRRMLNDMSGAARHALVLRLTGGVPTTGAAEEKVK